jgi:hypothetical protein
MALRFGMDVCKLEEKGLLSIMTIDPSKIMNLIKEQVKDHLLGIAAKSEIAGILFYTCKEVLELKHPNKSEIAKTIGICNPTLNKVIEILRFFYSQNENMKTKLFLIK